jgi:hypothetical protein
LRDPSASFAPVRPSGTGPRGLHAAPSPLPLKGRGTSSHRVRLPFRVSPGVPAESSGEDPAALGVPSPTAFEIVRSPLHPGLPHPVRCALRLSQPLGAFLLRTPPGLVPSR